MTTLQEQFEKDFPDKTLEIINASGKYWDSNFTNRDLDLREYINVVILELSSNKITSINLSECKRLDSLFFTNNSLTSIDFLDQLPHPEYLESLYIHDKNIQPTDISFFSKFIDLKILWLGTINTYSNKRNKFYGSLKAYQNLTRLESIHMEATDINKDLKYLPQSLVMAIKNNRDEKDKYSSIACSPHKTNAKCKAIQDQLRPFNYDLEAWQLANPDKMAKVWKEKKLIQDLETEINQVRQEKEQLEKIIINTYQQLNSKKPNLDKIKTELLEAQIKSKKRKLEKLKCAFKNKLDKNLQEQLDNLLEAQIALTQNNVEFIQRQFNKAKEKLGKRLSNEEIENICQRQIELDELKLQKVETEAKVEVNSCII